jgi:adenylate cyclase
LAAILAADVAGYSRLMGRDENGTLARLKAHRTERLEPILARHGGRLVKLTGDGALVEFASAVDALGAAIEFQQAMADANRNQPEDSRIVFRVGLHLGDLIVDGDDLYGDGVNVAARLEAETPQGGIVISGDVHNAVVGKLKATFDDLGSLALKNIDRPVRAFRAQWSQADWPAVERPSAPSVATVATARDEEPLALPDKPSIAVLPFTNMSGDSDQEYFTDGVTEDIITELSRFHELFVIARNSSFTYKGKAVDVRTVATDLGVRYVLEGSVRKVAKRIRVTGQLIDAVTGNHLWADRYDRVLEDVFAVQEELTQSIVRAIAPHISEIELAKAQRRRPENLSAYDIAIRAHAKAWESWIKSDRVLREEAIGEARAALAIDTTSTIALNALALGQMVNIQTGTVTDAEAAWQDGMVAATRSIELDRTGNIAHSIRGHLLAQAPDASRRGEALANARRGYDLNPNSNFSLTNLAYVEINVGDAAGAISLLHQALRISPRDPLRHAMHFQLARATFAIGKYASAVEYATVGISEAPLIPNSHRHLAMSLVGLGEFEKAKAALDEARRIAPDYVERGLAGNLGYGDPEQHRRGLTFLRIAAGLEEPSAAEALR